MLNFSVSHIYVILYTFQCKWFRCTADEDIHVPSFGKAAGGVVTVVLLDFGYKVYISLFKIHHGWSREFTCITAEPKFPSLHKTSMFDLKQRSCSFQTVYKGTCKLELWPQTELGFLHGNWGFQSSCFSPAAVPTFSNRSSGLYVSLTFFKQTTMPWQQHSAGIAWQRLGLVQIKAVSRFMWIRCVFQGSLHSWSHGCSLELRCNTRQLLYLSGHWAKKWRIKQINSLMRRSSTRMRSMVLTLDTILQAEFCTNPPLRTFFGIILP